MPIPKRNKFAVVQIKSDGQPTNKVIKTFPNRKQAEAMLGAATIAKVRDNYTIVELSND